MVEEVTVELRGSVDDANYASERFPVAECSVVEVHNENASPSAAPDCPIGCAFTDGHRDLFGPRMVEPGGRAMLALVSEGAANFFIYLPPGEAKRGTIQRVQVTFHRKPKPVPRLVTPGPRSRPSPLAWVRP